MPTVEEVKERLRRLKEGPTIEEEVEKLLKDAKETKERANKILEESRKKFPPASERK